MSKSEQKRICIQSDCAVRDTLLTQIADLKKKRTKGEINEAYAKTIEKDKDVISDLKSKVNKLQAKCARRKENQIKLNAENKRMADVVEDLTKALGVSNICLHDWAVKGGAKNTFDILSSNSKLIDKIEALNSDT